MKTYTIVDGHTHLEVDYDPSKTALATTTSNTLNLTGDSTIQSVTLTNENTLEVIRRVKPNFTYAVYHNSTPPDSIYKDIYGVVDGKLTLIETKVGKHTPQHVVPESIEF